MIITMALNLSIPRASFALLHSSTQRRGHLQLIKCELKDTKKVTKLEIGSPIIVVEAPKLLKTAASIPCLRPNTGLVKPGDVGRIVSRKPMDVWAVRLSIGNYLLDEKYFKPLDLDEI